MCFCRGFSRSRDCGRLFERHSCFRSSSKSRLMNPLQFCRASISKYSYFYLMFLSPQDKNWSYTVSFFLYISTNCRNVWHIFLETNLSGTFVDPAVYYVNLTFLWTILLPWLLCGLSVERHGKACPLRCHAELHSVNPELNYFKCAPTALLVSSI